MQHTPQMQHFLECQLLNLTHFVAALVIWMLKKMKDQITGDAKPSLKIVLPLLSI